MVPEPTTELAKEVETIGYAGQQRVVLGKLVGAIIANPEACRG